MVDPIRFELTRWRSLIIYSKVLRQFAQCYCHTGSHMHVLSFCAIEGFPERLGTEKHYQDAENPNKNRLQGRAKPLKFTSDEKVQSEQENQS
jgi:hypothetical protein